MSTSQDASEQPDLESVLKGGADTVTTATRGAEPVAAQTAAVFSDLSGKLEKALQEGLQALRTEVKPMAATAEEGLETAQKFVVEQVRAKPLTSAVAALGVGVLVGLLLSGRRR